MWLTSWRTYISLSRKFKIFLNWRGFLAWSQCRQLRRIDFITFSYSTKLWNQVGLSFDNVFANIITRKKTDKSRQKRKQHKQRVGEVWNCEKSFQFTKRYLLTFEWPSRGQNFVNFLLNFCQIGEISPNLVTLQEAHTAFKWIKPWPIF